MKRNLSLSLAESMPLSFTACSSDISKAEAGGYLAVYPAVYEPDMGVEFAQFPSKEYTNTYRTNVLFYGISKDGVSFEPLNGNKAVMSPEGCEKLNMPSLFKKHGGGYGLIASIDNKSSKIIVFDSDDLLYYTNQRIVELNDEGIAVKNPTVERDPFGYKIYWEGGDGKSYITTTSNFEKFSKPTETDYKKETISASLPDYAVVEEASVFELTAEEYDRIVKKYGRLHSVLVEADDVSVKAGQEISLPNTVNIVYSDGSKTPMGVEWDLGGIDLKNLAEGEYTVRGNVTAAAEYNSPLASYRADPYVVYDKEKSVYYFTGSNLNERSASGGGAYSSIVIRQANSLNEITDAEGEYKGTFGPGHNTFTVDDNGNPVIIYHARDWDDEYPGATGANKYGLVDPGRHAYARPVIFNYEGFPVCNLTAEEYLAESLKKIEIKITVK